MFPSFTHNIVNGLFFFQCFKVLNRFEYIIPVGGGSMEEREKGRCSWEGNSRLLMPPRVEVGFLEEALKISE
jgi:hypothetical protein